MAGKLAVQMYTVRDFTQTADELTKTFKRIREIGYEAVQLSAVGAMNGESPEVDAPTARRMLDEAGLTCIATHRPWDQLRDATEAEIEFHQILGCDYTAIGGIPGGEGSQVAVARQWLAEAAPVIEKLKAAGIRFGHHNHAHEFVHQPEAEMRTVEDVLVSDAPADLQFELDLYWITHAGANPVKWVERCSGRIPVIHLKDREVLPDQGQDTHIAAIGEGNMDWESIIPACEANGVDWYCIEQDVCRRDPFDCLKASYEFLSGMGLS